MSQRSVAIIDSGGANINSIVFAFERLGYHPVFTDDWVKIQAATHVVLPGVGSASAAMERLNRSGLTQKIPTLTQPVIGICLGMQLLFQSSGEGGVDCLGIIPAKVRSLQPFDSLTIPHMGWNRNYFTDQRPPMFEEIGDGFYSYFVHSFAAPLGPWTVAQCRHGDLFSSIVSHRNFTGIQFHPERSSSVGEQLLECFVNFTAGVET